MARLLGPDPNSRMAIRPGVGGRRLVEGIPGRIITVYADEALTTLADIASFQPGDPDVPGATIPSSQLRVGNDSRVPLFWFPDGADTLWARTRDGGQPLVLVADLSSRFDAIPSPATSMLMSWNGSAYVAAPDARVYGGPQDPGAVPDGSVWIDTSS